MKSQRPISIIRIRPAVRPPHARHGLSLLETTMAFSLAALLLTPVVGLLHTTRQVWELSDNHRSRLSSLHGTLRHVSRQLRSAQSVLTLESRPGTPSLLEFRGIDGQVERWTHDPKSGNVMYSKSGRSGILAQHIAQLGFEAFTADGKTPAKTISDIHCLRCTAVVKLKKKNNETRTSECWVWLRGQKQNNGPPIKPLPPDRFVLQPTPVR